jgi:hypothetical protein
VIGKVDTFWTYQSAQLGATKMALGCPPVLPVCISSTARSRPRLSAGIQSLSRSVVQEAGEESSDADLLTLPRRSQILYGRNRAWHGGPRSGLASLFSPLFLVYVPYLGAIFRLSVLDLSISFFWFFVGLVD